MSKILLLCLQGLQVICMKKDQRCNSVGISVFLYFTVPPRPARPDRHPASAPASASHAL